MRAAIAGAMFVERQHLVNLAVAARAQEGQLCCVERVAHDDEAVAIEQLCRAFDLARGEHFQALHAVVLAQVRRQRADFACVAGDADPAEFVQRQRTRARIGVHGGLVDVLGHGQPWKPRRTA